VQQSRRTNKPVDKEVKVIGGLNKGIDAALVDQVFFVLATLVRCELLL